MIKKLIAITLFFALFSTAVNANTVNLNFGVYGSERRNWVDDQNAPILDHLEKSLSAKLDVKVKINVVFFPAYQDAVDALVNKKIDFSRLGGASYVEVKRRSPNVTILASESNKGNPYYEGVIGVLKDSPIEKVEQLKGKSFAFGNKSSTIGRYLSQKFLIGNGISAEDLAGYNYLGRHDNVAMAIIREVYDAGAFKEDILKNKNFSKRIRALARFKAPTQTWVARDGLDATYLNLLKKSLLNTPKEVFIIKNRDGFIESNDENFESLRVSIENNALFFLNSKTQ